MNQDTLSAFETSNTLKLSPDEKEFLIEQETIQSIEQSTKTLEEVAASSGQLVSGIQTAIPSIVEAAVPVLSLLIRVGGASASLLACFWLVLLTLKPMIEVLGVTASPIVFLLALYLVLAVLSRVLGLVYDILQLFQSWKQR
ncbi:MAG: hypothetical protein ABG776_03490 [Cyanobacteria bacterium J06555_13]